MRFDSPLQLFERTATEDVEIGGVTVAAGQKIAALLGSANRDPAVFADPDTLDVGRTDNPHISFGAGVHFCIGAPLARVELQASFGALLDRTSSLELGASRAAPSGVRHPRPAPTCPSSSRRRDDRRRRCWRGCAALADPSRLAGHGPLRHRDRARVRRDRHRAAHPGPGAGPGPRAGRGAVGRPACTRRASWPSLVDDPALVDDAQFERWARDFDSWDLCDQVCQNLFRRTPRAYDEGRRVDDAGTSSSSSGPASR